MNKRLFRIILRIKFNSNVTYIKITSALNAHLNFIYLHLSRNFVFGFLFFLLYVTYFIYTTYICIYDYNFFNASQKKHIKLYFCSNQIMQVYSLYFFLFWSLSYICIIPMQYTIHILSHTNKNRIVKELKFNK